jgi:AAA family ATP:ADP antiporter
VSRLRRYLDVRSGEGLPVLLAFSYIAIVAASFLLARPIRNSLFLRQYGPYALVYVYAAVPAILALFVPVYSRVTARFGHRAVTVATLAFFTSNVLLFWYAFTYFQIWILPAVFYVWVNCFAAIAPVQAWSLTYSWFDAHQARRLFGLVGAGASLGAICGGLAARFLVRPVGGTVNMMLVLAALILVSGAIVTYSNLKLPRRGLTGRPQLQHPFRDSLRYIRSSRYLQLMAASVFFVAVVTQWTGFQLSLVAGQQYGTDADALTRFFGTFNFSVGSVAFVLQLLLAGPALRRFGLAITILVLPLSLGLGTTVILFFPVMWSVLLTNSFDQGLRFSLDRSTYELLYLPLPTSIRAPLKNAIDIVVSRMADASGAVLLGLATVGFWKIPGAELGLRGTAAINALLIVAWVAVAWRLRAEYVRTIRDSIHKHRMDAEHATDRAGPLAPASALRTDLSAADPDHVRHVLSLIEVQQARQWQSEVRELLTHPEPDIRQRALAMLSAARDRTIAGAVTGMLRDPDLGVRTEALLYLTRELGIDPLRQLEQLGDFEDFSIRAGMAAFLASPGRTQNLDAARLILQAMSTSNGPEGIRDRVEAARLVALVPDAFTDLLEPLLGDPVPDVARQAIRTARSLPTGKLRPALVNALARSDLLEDAANALAHHGDPAVAEIERRLTDPDTPLEIKRELPAVLVRIGTPWAARVLVECLLQADVTLRHRIVVSLNQLQSQRRDIRIDRDVVELMLAAEIAGHYRSYQVFVPLRARLKAGDEALAKLTESMEGELARIFRLMALLYPDAALHDAYIGVRSSSAAVRANALEFLENILPVELRQVLLPLIDRQVSDQERKDLADRLVGAPLETTEQAVATLLASGDPWLSSSGVHAVVALQLHGLEPAVRKLEQTGDTTLRQSVHSALERLATAEAGAEPDPLAVDRMNVGTG